MALKITVLVVVMMLVTMMCVSTTQAAPSAQDTPTLTEADLTKTYYELLGIPSTANAKDVKKAYRIAALVNHPDKFKDPKQKNLAERVFVRVVRGYETLNDAMKRRQYDKMLEVGVVDYDMKAFSEAQEKHGVGEQFMGSYDDLSFSDAEQVYFEEAFDEEVAGPLLGLGMVGTFLLCVAPVVYGLYTMRPKKVKVGKFIKSVNPKVAGADKEQQQKIEEEIAARRADQERQVREKQEQEAAAARRRKEKEEQRGDETEQRSPSKNKRGGWITMELRLLREAAEKYPVGTTRRIELIANHVNTGSKDLLGARSKKEVTDKLKEIEDEAASPKNKKPEPKKEQPQQQQQQQQKETKKAATPSSGANKAEEKKKAATPSSSNNNNNNKKGNKKDDSSSESDWENVRREEAEVEWEQVDNAKGKKKEGKKTPASSPSHTEAARPVKPPMSSGKANNATQAVSWTPAEQEAFLQAIKKYPSSTADRWAQVAKDVSGKNAKQCEQHFEQMKVFFQ